MTFVMHSVLFDRGEQYYKWTLGCCLFLLLLFTQNSSHRVDSLSGVTVHRRGVNIQVKKMIKNLKWGGGSC